MEQQPLHDDLVLNAYIIPWDFSPMQAGALQVPAIPPAWTKLTTVKGRGETEHLEKLGRREIARSVAVNSLCPKVGHNFC